MRCYPTVIRYKKVLLPHLALQMARYELGVQTPVKVGDGFVLVGDRKIPTHEGGYALIDYCGKKENAFPNYSASDVLSGKVGKGIFLIRSLADHVSYNSKGNVVEIVFNISSINQETTLNRISQVHQYFNKQKSLA